MEIELLGEKLLLSANKVIYWPKKKIAFIADLHLGKTTHFRKAGIAVPIAIIRAEIDRIEDIISKYQPKQIFFLGDLFHSDLNCEWDIFNEFLDQHHDIDFTLIKGNHDILNPQIYTQSRLKIEQEPFQHSPFILSHHPLDQRELDKSTLNLCGHIHPGISIKGKGRSYLRLPCFYKEEKQLTLPAFGRFTGLAKINPKKGSSAFVVMNDSVKKFSK